MSTIVSTEDKINGVEHKILTKGAPEIIKQFLKQAPANYDKIYLKYVKNGARVLALAYKNLQKMSADSYTQIKREEAESNLIFCGFIVSECPLKPDTRRVIKEMIDSRHMVKMITGDNQLTAAYIGKELQFGPSDKSLFAVAKTDKEITWVDADEVVVKKTVSAKEVGELAKTFMLCINGDVLDTVFTSKEIS
jgi:cation-transporting ATPase 13A1